MKLFAVTGRPVFHSMSPQIFNSLFRLYNMDASYIRLAATTVEEVLSITKALRIKGLNITSPFKEDIIPFLDRLHDDALRIGAVNCVVVKEGKYIGYNTDSIGAVKALKKNNINPENKNIAVLGAGGAARAAVFGMIKAHARKVTIINRTKKRAKDLASLMGCEYSPLELFKEVIPKSDVLISCIPCPLFVCDQDSFSKHLVVLDANYKNPLQTGHSKTQKHRIISGLEWLFYQAVPAFQYFTGRKINEGVQQKVKRGLQKSQISDKPNVALVGFMGSGKTAVGRLLADKTGFEFVDTDALIENLSGRKINQIFQEKGEEVFREMERTVIKAEIPSYRRKVVSIGGGAVLDPENRKILNHNCHIIWLWNSIRTALKRIHAESRPLLNYPNPTKRAEKNLNERIPFYAELSDIVISTESGEPGDIVERIKNEMGQAFKN